MPRIPRTQLPSPAWYHVICRGVEQRRIMLDDLDREAWFKLFEQVAREFGWKVHAWCLLDNHFHALVETTQPRLSAGMQRLNGLYAIRFNRRYDRKGHLFQGRFESRVIESEEYLATVMPYIYENSTRVGLHGWPWRGIGSIPRPHPRSHRRDLPRRRARILYHVGCASRSTPARRSRAAAPSCSRRSAGRDPPRRRSSHRLRARYREGSLAGALASGIVGA